MALYLQKNFSEFSKLPYKEIRTYLVAYGVIEHNEKIMIDQEQSQMAGVLNIILRNLHLKQTKPFKRFLELMEQSSDQCLQEAAERLG